MSAQLSPDPQRNERDFFIVVKLSSALGLGTMAAFLYSLKEVHPDIRLEFGVGTVIVFLVMGAASWVFCGMMARADAESDSLAGRSVARRRFFKRWLLVFGAVCMVGTVAAFARSLRNVGADSRRDVMIGTALAVVVLSCGGWLIHRAVKFFEEQDKASLDELRREDDDTEAPS